MKSIVTLALVVAGCIAGAPAFAKDFIFVHKGKTDMRFIDRGSIATVDDRTKSAWFVTIFEAAGVQNGVKQSQGQFYLRCSDRQWAVKAARAYDASGTALDSQSVTDAELAYEPAAPDTVVGRMLDLVCGIEPVAEKDVYQADDVWHLQAGVDRLNAVPAAE